MIMSEDRLFRDDVAARVDPPLQPRSVTMADYTARRHRARGTVRPWHMPAPAGKAWRDIARGEGIHPIRVYSPYWTAEQIDAWDAVRHDPATYRGSGNPYRDDVTGRFLPKPKAEAAA